MKKLILTSAFVFSVIFLNAQFFTVKGVTLGDISELNEFYTTLGGIYGRIQVTKLKHNYVASISFIATDKNGEPDYHSRDEIMQFKSRVEQYYKISYYPYKEGPLEWVFTYNTKNWAYSSYFSFDRREDHQDAFVLYLSFTHGTYMELYKKENPEIPDKLDSDF